MALTVPPVYENRWAPPTDLSELELLVYRSNLLASSSWFLAVEIALCTSADAGCPH